MSYVVFTNAFHNGDIHASRGLVRKTMEKVKQIDPNTIFSYAHRNPANLLGDIPELNYAPHLLGRGGNEHSNLTKYGDMVFVNTWYGQQNYKFMNHYGISFDTLYAALDDTCQQQWGFKLETISQDPRDFYPAIDYSCFEIGNASAWLAAHPEKKVLVENGLARSDQANNIPLTPTIIKLAQKHPEITFILTTPEGMSLPSNVVHSHDIIQKTTRSDLNETSFLSSKCDLIIGRASGVFAFTLTYDNLFNRKMQYLCFSNLVPKKENQFWLNDLMQDRIAYSATIMTTNESNIGTVYNIIEDKLKG